MFGGESLTGAPVASVGVSPQPARPRPATRAALCRGVRRPGPLAGLAAALPGHWARAHAGPQQPGKAVYTGREGSSSARDRPTTDDSAPGRPRAARGVAHAPREPPTGRTARLAHLGGPEEALPFSRRPPPGPPRRLRAARRPTKFLGAAGGPAYLGGWARARRARAGRRFETGRYAAILPFPYLDTLAIFVELNS
ncbi:hypothetical protein GH733_002961 [Mirounga leonina]|nr:hypothetical protein GH733_002961 [Mirounga leonina]